MPMTATDTSLRTLFGLEGRVAIVPGGTGDIGCALACRIRSSAA